MCVLFLHLRSLYGTWHENQEVAPSKQPHARGTCRQMRIDQRLYLATGKRADFTVHNDALYLQIYIIDFDK